MDTTKQTVTINALISVDELGNNITISSTINKAEYDILYKTDKPDDKQQIVSVKIFTKPSNGLLLGGFITSFEDGNNTEVKILLDAIKEQWDVLKELDKFTTYKIEITVDSTRKTIRDILNGIADKTIKGISEKFAKTYKNIRGVKVPITIIIKNPTHQNGGVLIQEQTNGGKLRKSRKYRKDKKPKNGGKSRKNKKSSSKKRR
jgi:hypothetical protein